jgi:hypothetical protein
MIDDMLGREQQSVSSNPMLQDYKKCKHVKKMTHEANVQYLKQYLLAQALVYTEDVILRNMYTRFFTTTRASIPKYEGEIILLILLYKRLLSLICTKLVHTVLPCRGVCSCPLPKTKRYSIWVRALVDHFIHHGTPELDWQDIVESIK